MRDEVQRVAPRMAHRWLDDLPLPAGIIREQKLVYVNSAYLDLLELPREAVLGLPYDASVAPEDRERIRERHRLRLEGERVPNVYEFKVVRASGERRTVEIFVSRAGDETLFQLHDVTERDRRQANLRALAQLGAALQRELDESAIFRRLAEGLNACGVQGVRFVPDGDGVRVEQLYVAAPPTSAELLSNPAFLAKRRPWGPHLLRAWNDGFAYLDDLAFSTVRFFGEQNGPAIRAGLSEAALTRGAMLRVERRAQPSAVLLLMSDWCLPEDEPALRLFAAQVSAALDAALSVAELSQRNAELTVINRVATTAGAERDLHRLFESASEGILRLLACQAVAIYLIEPEGAAAVLAYDLGASEEARLRLGRVPLANTNLGKVVEAKAGRIWRATDFDPERQALLRRLGQEVVLSVPMMVRSRVVGVINVGHAAGHEPRPSALELVQGVAVHLAAAVESHRLVEDLRRSYEELSSAQAQLVKRERLAAIGEMAAAVAHEVRNPLGVIFNAVASLRREAAPQPNVLRLAAMLTEESERINHLVTDLLCFARPAQPVLSAQVALPGLVEDAVAAVLLNAEQKVGFALHNADEIGAVAMDVRLMRQVLVNLVENAVQAMPGGGRLDIELRRGIDGDPDRVEVEVRDTGQGIRAEVLPRVFEPFFTTRARGTGLGLALVQQIIQGHRGALAIESTPGQGTRVRFGWPGLAGLSPAAPAPTGDR